MKIGIGLLMVLWVGCFAGRDRVGSDREALRSEVEFVEVDEGLESSVQIDSLIWQPFLPLPGSGLEGSGDFDGAYQAVFRKRAYCMGHFQSLQDLGSYKKRHRKYKKRLGKCFRSKHHRPTCN